MKTNRIAIIPLVLLLCSCAGILPGNDPVIVRYEQTYTLAKATFDLIQKTEFDTYASLKAAAPSTATEVRTFVNMLRNNQAQWLQTALDADTTYRKNKTPENKANLDTALAVLQWGIDQSNAYLAQIKLHTGN